MLQDSPGVLPKPSLEQARHFITQALPNYVELLKRFENHRGQVTIDPRITQCLKNLNIADYAKYYQLGDRLTGLFLAGVVGPQAVPEFCAEIEQALPHEVTALLDELLAVGGESDLAAAGLLPSSPEQQAATRRAFEALAPDEQQALVLHSTSFWLTFIIGFFEILALVVHGQRMTHLVAQALAGDDIAFVKAAQLDRTVLTNIPYFRERHERAMMTGESEFQDKLHYRLNNPPLRSKRRHRELWLVLAMLDWLNLLDGSLKDREILELCDAAGLDRWGNRIEDVHAVTQRRLEFQRNQRSAALSML